MSICSMTMDEIRDRATQFRGCTATRARQFLAKADKAPDPTPAETPVRIERPNPIFLALNSVRARQLTSC